jgi:hypothetical protein
MRVLATLIPIHIICVLFILGCASTSKKEHLVEEFVVPLKSIPMGAKITVDEEFLGYTPSNLIITHLPDHDKHDETRKRSLKIETGGYAPYVLTFSIKGKEYKKIPNIIVLAKREDKNTVPVSADYYQKIMQELEGLNKNHIEISNEIEKIKNEIVLLKKDHDTQKNMQYIDPVKITDSEALSKNGAISEKAGAQEKKYPAANQIIKKSAPKYQDSANIIYTVQTGSFHETPSAQNQFDFLLQKLNKKDLEYLRIEKIGKYYAVRIGRFQNYDSAEKLLATIEPFSSSVIIVKAYIKDNRIIKRHMD